MRQAVNSYGKTSRHVDGLARNVTSLQTDVEDIQAALNRSTGGAKIDHKSNVTDRLIARLSRQLLGKCFVSDTAAHNPTGCWRVMAFK